MQPQDDETQVKMTRNEKIPLEAGFFALPLSRESRDLHFVECLRLGAFHAGREDHHDLFHAGAVHAQNAERVTLNLDFGAR